MAYFEYGIVGFGIAGQLLILELLQRSVQPEKIIIFDENFLGGALATQYGEVTSNTPWEKTRKALAEYPQWSQHVLQKGDQALQLSQCMPVSTIARYCLEVATLASPTVEKLTTRVKTIEQQQNTESGLWTVTHTFGTQQVKKLFLCHGAEEKGFELCLPRLSLTIALDKSALMKHVTKSDSILLFGLSHSGTLVLKHLGELMIPTIAVYNTPQPFMYARDGIYDGIKEDSATVADTILAGKYPCIKLQKFDETFPLLNAVRKATKVIYATGFTPRVLDGQPTVYDSTTATLGPNLFGYGIAFPGITELNGKKYVDVSVLSFQEQIRRTLPIIIGV
jgi:hypothetical protein